MKQIRIAGRLVTVPKGYLQAEDLYTADEDKIFNSLSSGAKKEQARAELLKKRIEFYDLYMAGKAIITPPITKVEKSTFQKVVNWLVSRLLT